MVALVLSKRCWCGAWLAALAACKPPSVALLERGEAAWSFAVFLDQDGAVTRIEGLTDQALFATAPQRVVLFEMDGDPLIRPGGVPWPRPEITPIAAAAGQTCAFGASDAPQLVAPGDACPIPTFARARAFRPVAGGAEEITAEAEEAIAIARATLRLAAPGPGCTTALGDQEVALRTERFGPNAEVPINAELDIAEDGSVLLAAPGELRWISDAGVQRGAVEGWAERIALGPPPVVPGAREIYARLFFDNSSRTTFWRGDLANPLAWLYPGIDNLQFDVLADQLYVMGEIGAPALWTCADGRCSEHALAIDCDSGGSVIGAGLLGDGRLVVAQRNGGVSLEAPGLWSCAAVAPADLVELAVFDQTIYACGHGPQGAVLFAGTVAPGAAQVDLREVGRSFGGCGGIALLREAPTLVGLAAGGSLLTLDGLGAPAPPVPLPPQAAQKLAGRGGWVLHRDFSGAIQRRPPQLVDGTLAPFEVVLPTTTVAPEAPVLLAQGGEAWAFGRGRYRYFRGLESGEIALPSLDDLIPDAASAQAAMLLYGIQDPGGRVRLRLEGSGDRLAVVAVEPVELSAPLVGAAQLASGQEVVATSDGVWILEGAAAIPIAECGDRWVAVEATPGGDAVFVLGVEHLLRITDRGPGRAPAVDALEQDSFWPCLPGEECITAIRPLCPNRLVAGGTGTFNGPGRVPVQRVARVALGSGPPSCGVAGLGAVVELQEPSYPDTLGVNPLVILGGGAPLAFDNSGVVHGARRRRIRLWGGRPVAAVLGDHFALVSFGLQRLEVVRW
jgi:hypothetical protein